MSEYMYVYRHTYIFGYRCGFGMLFWIQITSARLDDLTLHFKAVREQNMKRGWVRKTNIEAQCCKEGRKKVENRCRMGRKCKMRETWTLSFDTPIQAFWNINTDLWINTTNIHKSQNFAYCCIEPGICIQTYKHEAFFFPASPFERCPFVFMHI